MSTDSRQVNQAAFRILTILMLLLGQFAFMGLTVFTEIASLDWAARFCFWISVLLPSLGYFAVLDKVPFFGLRPRILRIALITAVSIFGTLAGALLFNLAAIAIGMPIMPS